jgi:predicted dehydrogenase
MEAMWTRFLPHMVRIRELLAQGAIGRVTTVHADHGQWFPVDASHRLYAPELGGGALLDLGIYPISFASMVLGTPSSIQAQAVPAFTGVDAQDSIVFGYPSGAQALLHTTLESATPCRAWIGGTDGHIDIEPTWYAATGFTMRTLDGREEHFASSEAVEEGGLGFEAAEVGRCLAAGLTESPILPLAETVAIMEQLDQIRRITGVSTHPV